MLQSTTPLSKIRPVNPEQDSLVKINLLIESMNRSPAKRSDFILIIIFNHNRLSDKNYKTNINMQSSQTNVHSIKYTHYNR